MVRVGDRYFLDVDKRIQNRELRWDNAIDMLDTLHKGQYVVARAGGAHVTLADANYTPSGRIISLSTKHGHIISKKDLKRLYKHKPEV